MINTGFDSDVVKKVAELKKKPLISGSGAYLMGVVSTLKSSYGQHMTLDIVESNENHSHVDGDFLLCAIANCSYYGGGFRALPNAKYDDGLLELLLVNKVSRATFIRIINDYKKGKHIDPFTGEVHSKYKKFLKLYHCKEIDISNINDLCIDGEIRNIDNAHITVLNKQIRLII